VRATTLLNNLLDLPGVGVSGMSFDDRRVLVEVRLRAQRLACPLCPFTTRARYDTRPVSSCLQHLDFGTATVVVRAYLRRVDCPEHGILVEAVPCDESSDRGGFDDDVVAGARAHPVGTRGDLDRIRMARRQHAGTATYRDFGGAAPYRGGKQAKRYPAEQQHPDQPTAPDTLLPGWYGPDRSSVRPTR
jgi:hypothetical protein